jgi:hypothetical protein
VEIIRKDAAVMTWPWMAVHAHMLPTGKVLYWPQFNNGDNPTLWDPIDEHEYCDCAWWIQYSVDMSILAMPVEIAT